MKKYTFLLLVISLSLPAIFSLVQPGFFQSDDGEWMIIRFSAFHQALADGQFPVRLLGRLNHEYGYPVANFLYPGFMYLAEPIHLAGFGFVDSIKIVLGLSMVLSALFCYLWLTKLFDKRAALVGALFYLYTPYHLYDLYIRGSVGEVLALAVLPFILWMIERKSFFLLALGIGILIISHNTLALLFLPLIAMYMVLRLKKAIIYHLSSVTFGFAIVAFFWVPALLDLRYTKFSQTMVSNWQDHFGDVALAGISSIVVLVVVIFIKKRTLLDIFFVALGAIGVFLSLQISSFIWQIVPTSFVQFPFRFLSLLLPSVAYLTARFLSTLPGKRKIFVSVVFVMLLTISAFPFFRPKEFFEKGDGFYATNEGTTTVQNEYMPEWVKIEPKERPQQAVELEQGEVSSLNFNANSVRFQATTDSESQVVIHRIYFPGYRVFVDKVESTFSYENEFGIITFPAHVGTHTYKVQYSESKTSIIADAISVFGFVGLLVVTWKKKFQYA